eukprot:CAMPEP_0194349204 /NCGR_PEP_ID=MMETSP0171-20130528/106952_1 /TAXON_ID=218684 /ORGANISM="Corethron pennatum, Strain L29A3" /LENGTH=884 /DNA_ID=CAMNT_0039116623 /DNA_START=168 /DNA_END=2819 /DNA_ORIENTATION=-
MRVTGIPGASLLRSAAPGPSSTAANNMELYASSAAPLPSDGSPAAVRDPSNSTAAPSITFSPTLLPPPPVDGSPAAVRDPSNSTAAPSITFSPTLLPTYSSTYFGGGSSSSDGPKYAMKHKLWTNLLQPPFASRPSIYQIHIDVPDPNVDSDTDDPVARVSLIPTLSSALLESRKGMSTAAFDDAFDGGGGGAVTCGGFTDGNWSVFPVWVLRFGDRPGWEVVSADGGRVLTYGARNGVASVSDRPAARTGHVSAVVDGVLYVYGGLLYGGGGRDGTEEADRWSVEADGGGVWSADLSPYLYRARGNATDPPSDGSLGWERHAVTNPYAPVPVARGEAAGGQWRHQLVFHGGMHVYPEGAEMDEPAGPGAASHDLHDHHSDDSQRGVFMDIAAETLFGMSSAGRGAVDDDEQQRKRDNRRRLRPLGDVWSYDVKTRTFALLRSYVEGKCPSPRISHAATVVGDTLVIYGGRSWDARSDRWIVLGDVWEFDLISLEWTERKMAPTIPRSYHSMVNWGGNLVVYGGYEDYRTFFGGEVELVYADTLVARHDDDIWYKTPQSPLAEPGYTDPGYRFQHSAAADSSTGDMYVWGGRFRVTRDVTGLWRTSVGDGGLVPAPVQHYDGGLASISMSMFAAMFLLVCAVFVTLARTMEIGGQGRRIRVLRRRRGMPRDVIESLPIGRFSSPRKDDQPAESFEEGNAESPIAAARSLDSSLAAAAAGGGDPASPTPNASVGNGPDGIWDDRECCSICLVDYEEGDEIRTMPCGHAFHPECVDPWLSLHTSCPQCRRSVVPRSVPAAEERDGEGAEQGYYLDATNGEEGGNDRQRRGRQRVNRFLVPSMVDWARVRRNRRRRRAFDSTVRSSLILEEEAGGGGGGEIEIVDGG